MPILQCETSQFPADLLDGFCAAESRWLAINTKARQEKALSRQLLSHEIPFYLPLAPKVARIGDRNFRSYIPIFPGYIFAYATDDQRAKIYSTNRICQALEVPDADQLRFDLCQVRDLIARNVPMTVESRIEPGQMVRIKSGPMEGFQGTVLARRGRMRILIAIRFLRNGVSIEIDDFMVEPIG